MAALITSIGLLITAAVGWMGTFLATITATGNEILLLFVLLPIVFFGVGLVKRMLHV